jgi:hypothetical protein
MEIMYKQKAEPGKQCKSFTVNLSNPAAPPDSSAARA